MAGPPPRPLNLLDTLAEHLTTLPTELQNMIADIVMHIPPETRNLHDRAYISEVNILDLEQDSRNLLIHPQHLRWMTLDRRTRANYAAAFYGKGSRILVDAVEDVEDWLTSMPRAHIKLIERVDYERRGFWRKRWNKKVGWKWDKEWLMDWTEEEYDDDERKVKAAAAAIGGEELARKIFVVRRS